MSIKIYRSVHKNVLSTDIKDFNTKIVATPQPISRPQLIPISFNLLSKITIGPSLSGIILSNEILVGNVYGKLSYFRQGALFIYTRWGVSFEDNVKKLVYIGVVDLDAYFRYLFSGGPALVSTILDFSVWTVFVGFVHHEIIIDLPPTDPVYYVQNVIRYPVYGSELLTQLIPINSNVPLQYTNIQPVIMVEGDWYSTNVQIYANSILYGFYGNVFTGEVPSKSALYKYNSLFNYAKYFNKATGEIF